MGASPQGVDWNNDGKVDLLTGEYEGQIRIYLNTGTAEEPAFEAFSYLQVGGTDFDCGETAKPDVVDWNNDGRKDLLVGVDGGDVLLLLNTGTNAAPEFASTAYVQDGGGNLNLVGGRASPVAVDWNRDGKKDLILGETSGALYYYENIGTDAAPAFSGNVLLTAGGVAIGVVTWSRPEAVDWDNDGVMDLLCGSYDSLAIPTSPIWYFHSDPGPVQLTTPVGATPVNRGDEYAVEWSGGNNNNALNLWQHGLTGWRELAAEVDANDQQYLWDTSAASAGWYCFAAFVKTGTTWAQTPVLGPGWVRLADPPAATSSLGAPAGIDAGAEDGADLVQAAEDAEPQAMEVFAPAAVHLTTPAALPAEDPAGGDAGAPDAAGLPSDPDSSPDEAADDADVWVSALSDDWLDVL